MERNGRTALPSIQVIRKKRRVVRTGQLLPFSKPETDVLPPQHTRSTHHPVSSRSSPNTNLTRILLNFSLHTYFSPSTSLQGAPPPNPRNPNVSPLRVATHTHDRVWDQDAFVNTPWASPMAAESHDRNARAPNLTLHTPPYLSHLGPPTPSTRDPPTSGGTPHRSSGPGLPHALSLGLSPSAYRAQGPGPGPSPGPSQGQGQGTPPRGSWRNVRLGTGAAEDGGATQLHPTTTPPLSSLLVLDAGASQEDNYARSLSHTSRMDRGGRPSYDVHPSEHPFHRNVPTASAFHEEAALRLRQRGFPQVHDTTSASASLTAAAAAAAAAAASSSSHALGHDPRRTAPADGANLVRGLFRSISLQNKTSQRRGATASDAIDSTTTTTGVPSQAYLGPSPGGRGRLQASALVPTPRGVAREGRPSLRRGQSDRLRTRANPSDGVGGGAGVPPPGRDPTGQDRRRGVGLRHHESRERVQVRVREDVLVPTTTSMSTTATTRTRTRRMTALFLVLVPVSVPGEVDVVLDWSRRSLRCWDTKRGRIRSTGPRREVGVEVHDGWRG